MPPLSCPPNPHSSLRAVAPQASEEEELRRKTEGMTAADAIKRILLAQKDKDYFRQGGGGGRGAGA